MPFTICVNRPGYLPEESPRAVETIEEARSAASDHIIGTPMLADDESHLLRWAAKLPESGGLIGPLPDGYVIEVSHVSYGNLWKAITGSKDNQPIDTADIVDAYNAQEG